MSRQTPDYSRYLWQGKRVRLRPLGVEDAEQSFIFSLDSPSRQYLQLGIELSTTVQLQRTILEKYAGCRDTDGVLVLAAENAAGDHVGGVSMHSGDSKNGLFSFGLIIARLHRGQGYAEDAARLMLKCGFRERRYQKCNSSCSHTNQASIRLHQKLGFLEEGRRRRQLFFNGEYHDDILFGPTREEFDAQEGS